MITSISKEYESLKSATTLNTHTAEDIQNETEASEDEEEKQPSQDQYETSKNFASNNHAYCGLRYTQPALDETDLLAFN